MKDIILKNLPFLIPILCFSILSFAIILERIWYFFLNKDRINGSIEETLSHLKERDMQPILPYINKQKSPLSRLLFVGLTHFRRSSINAYKARLQGSAREELYKMEKTLDWLPAIGNIVTLIGLLGTVTGMITAFRAMLNEGSADPYFLAGGISQALISTAAGLCVAIPAIISYHFFINLCQKNLDQMARVTSELMVQKEQGRTPS